MNNIAHLTSFDGVKYTFKRLSVPSRQRYIMCIVSLFSKMCFQTYRVLNVDPFSIIKHNYKIKIDELKHNIITDHLMLYQFALKTKREITK